MDEQNYKEYTKVLKESGIPLDMQKELQRLIDQEYLCECCTGATDSKKEV